MPNTLLDNMILLNPPPGMEKTIRHQRNPSGSAVTMEQVKKHWSQGDNFKDAIRKEVLEYIVKGFEKIYVGGKDTLNVTHENLRLQDAAEQTKQEIPN